MTTTDITVIYVILEKSLGLFISLREPGASDIFGKDLCSLYEKNSSKSCCAQRVLEMAQRNELVGKGYICVMQSSCFC